MDTTTILAGGRVLPVVFLDGHQEDVKVRQLPIRLLEAYDAKQADEPALVELYCDREKGWADTLTHEAYEAIVTTGDEINRVPFERMRERMAGRLGLIRESRAVFERAGIIPPPKVPGEILVMPEIRPVEETPTPIVVPVDAAPAASPSTTSSAASALPASSPPENGH